MIVGNNHVVVNGILYEKGNAPKPLQTLEELRAEEKKALRRAIRVKRRVIAPRQYENRSLKEKTHEKE